MIKQIRHQTISEVLTLEHYQGSLDFDCDFCKSNAYDNFHICKDGNLEFVICAKCLDKAHKQSIKKGGH